MAAPAEHQGSAYMAARDLKKVMRPAGVVRSVPVGTEASVQDCRIWKVHVDGSGEGTSWTIHAMLARRNLGGERKGRGGGGGRYTG